MTYPLAAECLYPTSRYRCRSVRQIPLRPFYRVVENPPLLRGCPSGGRERGPSRKGMTYVMHPPAAISNHPRAAMSHVVVDLQSVAQPCPRQPTVRAATHGSGGARRQARAWAPCSATPGPGQEDGDATGAGPAPWSDFYSVLWDDRGGAAIPP